MKIEHHKPAARGVATLMYVGDDDAVDKAVGRLSRAEIGIGVVGIAAALMGDGVMRGAGAVAALWVGARYFGCRV